MEVDQMDVNSAYLNGDIDAEIYMKQPEGYVDPDNPNEGATETCFRKTQGFNQFWGLLNTKGGVTDLSLKGKC